MFKGNTAAGLTPGPRKTLAADYFAARRGAVLAAGLAAGFAATAGAAAFFPALGLFGRVLPNEPA